MGRGRFLVRRGARRDVVHRASGATRRGGGHGPPEALFPGSPAASRAFDDAPHRQAARF